MSSKSGITSLARPGLHKAALAISWVTILVFSILDVVGMRDGVLIPHLIIAAALIAHAVFIVAGRMRVAFRFTITELFYLGALFFFFLYPPVPTSRMPPLDIRLGGVGFWVAAVGSAIFAAGIWTCHLAALDWAAGEKA